MSTSSSHRLKTRGELSRFVSDVIEKLVRTDHKRFKVVCTINNKPVPLQRAVEILRVWVNSGCPDDKPKRRNAAPPQPVKKVQLWDPVAKCYELVTAPEAMRVLEYWYENDVIGSEEYRRIASDVTGIDLTQRRR